MGEIEGVQTPVIAWAEREGWLVRRLQYIGRRGAPDALFARNGVVLLIEFKKRGADLRVQQERERKRFADVGVHVYKVDTQEQGIDILRRARALYLEDAESALRRGED